jgi:hypothetical protein
VTTKDYLPWVVVGGYAVGGLLVHVANRLPWALAKKVLKPFAIALMVVDTLFWLWVGAGPSGMVIILMVLVVVPFVLVVTTRLLGARRRARAAPGTVLKPVWPQFIALAWAVPLGVYWLYLTLNPLLHLVGLSDTVDFHVSGVWENPANSDTSSSFITGTYVLDGQEHLVERTYWMTFGDLPHHSDTIRVGIAPLWPHTVFESAQAAWAFLALGTLVVLPMTVMIGGLALTGKFPFWKR